MARTFPYRRGGDLENDNNGAERSLRGIAVGRKHPAEAAFFGSGNGGRTAAILTGLLAMCEAMEIYPSTYLCDLFQHLRVQPMNQVPNVLANNWQAAPAPH